MRRQIILYRIDPETSVLTFEATQDGFHLVEVFSPEKNWGSGWCQVDNAHPKLLTTSDQGILEGLIARDIHKMIDLAALNRVFGEDVVQELLFRTKITS